MAKLLDMRAKRLQAILSAFTATHTKRKKYLSSFPQGLAEKLVRKSLLEISESYEFEQEMTLFFLFKANEGIRHLTLDEFPISETFATPQNNKYFHLSFLCFIKKLERRETERDREREKKTKSKSKQ